jgi:hypothetical protein
MLENSLNYYSHQSMKNKPSFTAGSWVLCLDLTVFSFYWIPYIQYDSEMGQWAVIMTVDFHYLY